MDYQNLKKRLGDAIQYPNMAPSPVVPMQTSDVNAMSDKDRMLMLLKKKIDAEQIPEVQAMKQKENDDTTLINPSNYDPSLDNDLNNPITKYQMLKNKLIGK